jgi:RNA polymerase sigma factor (sigma-70 family)
MGGRSLGLPWGIAAPDAYAEGRASDAAELQRAASRPATEQFDLETVYRTRRPEMIRYLVSFGVEVMEAEDITQEGFLSIFGKEQRQNSPEDLFSWALVCARNLAVNRYHRNQRTITAPASVWKLWEDTLPDPRSNAESNLQEQDRCRKLTEWISKLADIEQKCVLMRSQGIPYREMARALNLPVRKVLYITGIALEKLRHQYRRQNAVS